MIRHFFLSTITLLILPAPVMAEGLHVQLQLIDSHTLLMIQSQKKFSKEDVKTATNELLLTYDRLHDVVQLEVQILETASRLFGSSASKDQTVRFTLPKSLEKSSETILGEKTVRFSSQDNRGEILFSSFGNGARIKKVDGSKTKEEEFRLWPQAFRTINSGRSPISVKISFSHDRLIAVSSSSQHIQAMCFDESLRPSDRVFLLQDKSGKVTQFLDLDFLAQCGFEFEMDVGK